MRDGAAQDSAQVRVLPGILSEAVAELHDRLLDWAKLPEGPFPVAEVLGCFHSFGKHFVPLSLLQALDAARAASVAQDADSPLPRFLDCALDKLDDTYSYRSYLGLPLLTDARPPQRVTRPGSGPGSGCDELLILLMADLVRHECRPREGAEPPRLMVPPVGLSAKRARLALRLLCPALNRVAVSASLPEAAELSKRAQALVDDRTDDLPGARALAEEIWRIFPEERRQRVDMSLLPVYVVDDEYLFIRTLQAYELVFMELAAATAEAGDAVRRGRIPEATELMRGCASTLRENRQLFSLQATMRAEAFLKFRGYTLGSSAIQSEGYKAFEALFARPDEDRMGSLAYASVPRVRELVAHRGTGLVDDVVSAEAEAAADPELRAALVEVDETHQQWKRTHLRIATRMIGDEPGSGNTDGVAYLRSVMDNKVFPKDLKGLKDLKDPKEPS
ncbi:tryptophan 2,3-dioxygenase family protein [Streptomyces apocyni]|uniref:tryptophan 2,3-dioxygenase family protein n=1 Tax=Streptomyces apocyni TaxID=2654677 RepID=UPI0012E9D108|nr:tryptophan 2,3-dioxygenase family protein [Streptomyces apocyni]